jgi:hypothetical protein
MNTLILKQLAGTAAGATSPEVTHGQARFLD